MKRGFLFAGQGQQFLFMGQDLSDTYPLASLIYHQAQEILGYDVRTLENDALQLTIYAQPALYVLGYVIYQLLINHGIEPTVCAGLSLGEYNALTAVESLSFEDGLRVIKKRSQIMSEAYRPYETAMAVCLRTTLTTVKSMIKDTNLEICNVNTPSQIVIGGIRHDLESFQKQLDPQKMRLLFLNVSTVSHMSLLEPSSKKLEEVLNTVSFCKPKYLFLNNVDGDYQTQGFVKSLSQQISKPTQLSTIIQTMRDDGIKQFIEIGPKGAIASCVKEICGRDVDVKTVYDVKTLKEVIL